MSDTRFAYGTSKAAVIGLTKSLAADLVQRRVGGDLPSVLTPICYLDPL